MARSRTKLAGCNSRPAVSSHSLMFAITRPLQTAQIIGMSMLTCNCEMPSPATAGRRDLLERAWVVLVDTARAGKTISYGELAMAVGLPHLQRSIHRRVVAPLCSRLPAQRLSGHSEPGSAKGQRSPRRRLVERSGRHQYGDVARRAGTGTCLSVA